MKREEAVDVIKEFVAYGKHVNAFVYKGSTAIPIEALNMAIEALEEEPKRGKWIDTKEEDPCWYICSECKVMVDEDCDYCPNCGSYNGGEKHEQIQELVRCKDCRHIELKDFVNGTCKYRTGKVTPDGFCERGEKR